jgi:hypothetical protein
LNKRAVGGKSIFSRNASTLSEEVTPPRNEPNGPVDLRNRHIRPGSNRTTATTGKAVKVGTTRTDFG